MIRRLIVIILALSIAACAAPTDRDGGIGGTGAPVTQEPAI